MGGINVHAPLFLAAAEPVILTLVLSSFANT